MLKARTRRAARKMSRRVHAGAGTRGKHAGSHLTVALGIRIAVFEHFAFDVTCDVHLPVRAELWGGVAGNGYQQHLARRGRQLVSVVGPGRSGSAVRVSRGLEQNTTSCPALTQSSPTIAPMAPEPMIPIFMRLQMRRSAADCDFASTGFRQPGRVPTIARVRSFASSGRA